jgi:hypothetical protein
VARLPVLRRNSCGKIPRGLVFRAGRGHRSGCGARRGRRGAGHPQQPGKSVAESVAAALEGRVWLLVIDNCEHVHDAAADLIEAILVHSATVRVLATSREVLGIAQEQVRLVRSLDSAAGIDAPAVTLFAERARSVASRFSVAEPDEAGAVVEICRGLDGIPLAIELAASRMASMTASEVRDRLDHRFRLLVGSRRALERHHTLRHAVAWSYDHLDDAEKPTSITAIPRPEPARSPLPNRRRRPLAGACGDRHASAKRPQYQSDSSRCASANALAVRGRGAQLARKLPGRGCRRAGVHRGSRGWCRLRLGVIWVGRRLRPRNRLRGSRIRRCR